LRIQRDAIKARATIAKIDFTLSVSLQRALFGRLHATQSAIILQLLSAAAKCAPQFTFVSLVSILAWHSTARHKAFD
jgi:hypothetical protein